MPNYFSRILSIIFHTYVRISLKTRSQNEKCPEKEFCKKKKRKERSKITRIFFKVRLRTYVNSTRVRIEGAICKRVRRKFYWPWRLKKKEGESAAFLARAINNVQFPFFGFGLVPSSGDLFTANDERGALNWNHDTERNRRLQLREFLQRRMHFPIQRSQSASVCSQLFSLLCPLSSLLSPLSVHSVMRLRFHRKWLAAASDQCPIRIT